MTKPSDTTMAPSWSMLSSSSDRRHGDTDDVVDDDDTDDDDTDDVTDDDDEDYDDETDDENDHKSDSYTTAGAAPDASVSCFLFLALCSRLFGLGLGY